MRLANSWSGTLILVFQPEEKWGTGAQSMVEGGLYDEIPVPDYVLGHHLMALKAARLASR